MTHSAIGLDLGSSEVRAVVVKISLRSREIVRIDREPVALDESGETNFDKVLEAAGRMMKRLNVTDETVYCAVTGELTSIRKVILPASASKRVQQVLKFELDEVLPYDIEDAVFDYIETFRNNEEIVLLSATVLTEQLEMLISGLALQDISPREVGVVSFSYLNKISTGGKDEEVTAFIDIGHIRTNIAILDQSEPTVRTVLRGGRELTEKLSEAGAVDFSKADIFKKEYGLTGRVGEVLRESLRPLIREIQQTFKGHLAAGGSPVRKVVLCGGGCLLLGLDRYLADALQVPVEIFELQLRDGFKPEDDPRGTTFALAYMLALREEVPRAKRINVRQGNLAFKGDFENLKSRAAWIGLCLVLIVFSWMVASLAEYSTLSDQVEGQRQALADKTKEVFGKPMSGYEEIAEALKGTGGDEAVPLPKKDAFDLVVELSKRIPPTVVHDIEQLEIKPKRVTITGIVNADLKSDTGDNPASGSETEAELEGETAEGTDLTPTDLIKQQLEAFTECFVAIRMGKVSSIDARRRYQMDIDSQCP